MPKDKTTKDMVKQYLSAWWVKDKNHREHMPQNQALVSFIETEMFVTGTKWNYHTPPLWTPRVLAVGLGLEGLSP